MMTDHKNTTERTRILKILNVTGHQNTDIDI